MKFSVKDDLLKMNKSAAFYGFVRICGLTPIPSEVIRKP